MRKRDAFLYMDPKGKKSEHAQCKSCMMWTGPKGQTCTIHGEEKVTGDMSCGLYVHGENHDDMIGKEMAAVTKEESGLLKAKVRCENCKSYEGDEQECSLFEMLNKMKGWELDKDVHPKGCCNAWDQVGSPGSLKELREKMDHENEDM